MQIWSEGYRVTGNEGTAQILGEGDGETLQEAIEDWAAKNPKSASYLRFSNNTFTYWGCRLFDNEIDARKSFG